MARAEPPVLLLIAGLDPSGGAGLIADVRVAERFGVRPVGVVTALTEQDTGGVRAVEPVRAETLAAQLRTLLADVEVAAVKIGMLGTPAIAAAVSEALAATAAPVVWDPVLLPTAGRVLLYDGDPREAMALLAIHLAVVTPNLAEAEVLGGLPIRSVADMRRAAAAIRAAGAPAVLVKGGHLGGPRAVDVLADADAIHELDGEQIAAGDVHGTGCALSTALAARLGHGDSLLAAAAAAKAFVAERLRDPVRPGRGLPAIL